MSEISDNLPPARCGYCEEENNERLAICPCCGNQTDPRRTGLENEASMAIVRGTLKHSVNFKQAARELRTRPPDGEAAQEVLEAFQKGAAKPWLTALLLGACQHELGYATAKAILLMKSRPSAESYAGEAMAMIRGEDALEDLIHVMQTAPKRQNREGAAGGLELIGSQPALRAIVAAAVTRKIYWTTGGSIVGDLNPDEEIVLALFAAREDRQTQIAIKIVDRCLRSPWRRAGSPSPALVSSPSATLLHAIAKVLAEDKIPLLPKVRETMNTFLQNHQAGGTQSGG